MTLRPGDPPASSLALAAGYGLVVAVGDPAYLKWPNDLMIYGAKVAGMLLERQNDDVVIGIGVNVAVAPKFADRETTCLVDDGISVTNVEDMTARLVEWVPWAIGYWRERGLPATIVNWVGEAHVLGSPLSVTVGEGKPLEGTFDGLTDAGSLRLRLPDGRVEIIHAGDVEMMGER